MIVTIKEVYDGRLPCYDVLVSYDDVEYEVVGSFDIYEEANLFADTLYVIQEADSVNKKS